MTTKDSVFKCSYFHEHAVNVIMLLLFDQFEALF